MARDGKPLPTLHKTCDKHGVQLHRQKMRGEHQDSVGWECIACRSEYDHDLYLRRKTGDVREMGKTVEPKRGAICEDCQNEKPLTGICDFC